MEQLSHELFKKGLVPESGGLTGTSQKIIDSLSTSGQQDDDMILIALEAPSTLPDSGIHYNFRSNFEEVNQACNWAAKEFDKKIFQYRSDIDFINLCLRETLLNAVEHGNEQNPEAFVDVSLYFKPDELRIDVSDEGSGFDLTEKLTEAESTDGFQIGKRGLLLMNAAADKIEIVGGTVSLFFYG